MKNCNLQNPTVLMDDLDIFVRALLNLSVFSPFEIRVELCPFYRFKFAIWRPHPGY
jgi:hypothetical protein